MKNLIRLTIICIVGLSLNACVDFKRKTSTKIKKSLRSEGGNWEVSKMSAYYIDYGREFVYETNEAIIGSYHFSKDEGGDVASTEAGTWTPIGGSSINILYQVFTNNNDDNLGLVAIYIEDNGSWQSDDSFGVTPGYDNMNMEWKNNETIYSLTSTIDTIVTHTYQLRNLGF